MFAMDGFEFLPHCLFADSMIDLLLPYAIAKVKNASSKHDYHEASCECEIIADFEQSSMWKQLRGRTRRKFTGPCQDMLRLSRIEFSGR